VDRNADAERAASRAIALDETSGQAFLIRGESRRAQKRFDEAIEDYHRALRVQEFRSGTVRSVAFYVVGTGMRKHRSGYQFLYRSQKASALYGLCAAEIGRENNMRAVHYCQNSLAVERDDPETHLLLGEAYSRLFNHDNRRAHLVRAKENYEATLRLNPHVERSSEIRRRVIDITELLPMVK
jgi:tetratricopeptide (TPR) repeat protein